MFCNFLIFFIALAFVTASFSYASTCVKTGYTCYGSRDGDTQYCSRWEPDSVCYENSCYSPSFCTQGSSTLGRSQPTCIDSGFVCGPNDEGSTSFCTQWKPNSICYSNTCYYPSNCINPRANSEFVFRRAQKDTVEDLLEKLTAAGDDDTIPSKFEKLIRENRIDAIESDFAGDIDIGDVANVYRALGYQGTQVVSSRTMQTFFDDELNVIGGQKGKTVAHGTMYSDSFSIRACFDIFNSKSKANKLDFVNKWNEDKRMSSAWVDTDNGSVCLQSDVQFTKYDKANIQLAKEHAAIFAVSVQSFHSIWAQRLQNPEF